MYKTCSYVAIAIYSFMSEIPWFLKCADRMNDMI